MGYFSCFYYPFTELCIKTALVRDVTALPVDKHKIRVGVTAVVYNYHSYVYIGYISTHSMNTDMFTMHNTLQFYIWFSLRWIQVKCCPRELKPLFGFNKHQHFAHKTGALYSDIQLLLLCFVLRNTYISGNNQHENQCNGVRDNMTWTNSIWVAWSKLHKCHT